MQYAVILNGVKNLLKADKRQPALIAHSQRGDPSFHSGWHRVVSFFRFTYEKEKKKIVTLIITLLNIMYRYQLEKYRGRSTRHVCPQCGRKNVFTRYVDTENNNIYICDIVGKCNRLDKCGYHYTPHQYFTDNPWKRDAQPREDGVSFFRFNREKEKKKLPPQPKRVSAGLPQRDTPRKEDCL